MPNLYKIITDITIPQEITSQNVVLTLDGMCTLAEYYKEKYKIDIIPIAVEMNIDTENASFILCNRIDEVRSTVKNEPFFRCGFVLHNLIAGEHGHAMPVIWEKTGNKEKLFLLDSQYLGDVSYEARPCDLIFKTDFSLNTELTELPGHSLFTYVLCDEGIIFVDKTNNTRVQIKDGDDYTTLKNLYSFVCQKNVSNGQAIELTEEDLKQVISITEFDMNQRSRLPKKFRERLAQRMPQVEIWASLGGGQIDLSSCTIDAMVILKDGLRIQPSLSEKAQAKFIEYKQGVNLFYKPEELLKTAQIASYAGEKSQANLDKIIHIHHAKNKEGLKAGTDIPITLRTFRERYETPVFTKNKTKQFGTYTIMKGKRFAQLLDGIEKRKQLTSHENNQQKIELNKVNYDSHNNKNKAYLEKNSSLDTNADTLPALSLHEHGSGQLSSTNLPNYHSTRTIEAALTLKQMRLFEKQQIASEKINQPVVIRDIIVRPYQKFSPLIEFCTGESMQQYDFYHRPSEERLLEHIKNLFYLANSEHRANYCMQNQNGTFSLKKGKENNITRLATSEFSFYTESPLSLIQFHALIEKIESMASQLEPNVHLLLSSFAVRDASNQLMNMTIYVEGKVEPALHIFAKNQASISDVDYRRVLIPFIQSDKVDNQHHASIIASDHTDTVSTGSVFDITTFGGAMFTQAIDVCIDHAYGHSKLLVQQKLRPDSSTEIIPNQIEQCITACGGNIHEENIVNSNAIYIDSMKGLNIDPSKKNQLSVSTLNAFRGQLSSQYKKTEILYQEHEHGYIISNPPFGALSYIVESMLERPAGHYKPGYMHLIQEHNQYAYKNQQLTAGKDAKKLTQNILSQCLGAMREKMLSKCQPHLLEQMFKTTEYMQKLKAARVIEEQFEFILKLVSEHDINDSVHFINAWKKNFQLMITLTAPAKVITILSQSLKDDLKDFDFSHQSIDDEKDRQIPKFF